MRYVKMENSILGGKQKNKTKQARILHQPKQIEKIGLYTIQRENCVLYHLNLKII